ncbi:GNAT family N-acetyltransferase [Actinoplanes sp. NPDC051470]|uniref:GNAT family N-acetyltransferase n=1 Tax=unclassified Actinoplanes TaxID=2626549 RepID=UPI00343AB8DB
MKLQPLTAEHADAVLAFETRNRAYFATSIPDRGDDYFAAYPDRHAALLAMQDAGTDRFHVMVTDDGTVAARVNLVHIEDGEAEIGYRVGQEFTGRGVATRSVRAACDLARTAYGLTRLHAVVTTDNPASRTVLLRNGFTPTTATVVNGRAAHSYVRPVPLMGE